MKVRGEGEQRIVRVWSSSSRVDSSNSFLIIYPQKEEPLLLCGLKRETYPPPIDTMNLLYQFISPLHWHNLGNRERGIRYEAYE